MAPQYIEIIDEAESLTVTIGESEFDIRRLSDDKSDELAAPFKVRRRLNDGRTYYEIPPERQAEYARALWDYVLIGWRHVVHPVTKQEIPCEPDVKVKLPPSVKERLLEAARGDSTAPAVDPTNGSGRRSGGSSPSPSGAAPSA